MTRAPVETRTRSADRLSVLGVFLTARGGGAVPHDSERQLLPPDVRRMVVLLDRRPLERAENQAGAVYTLTYGFRPVRGREAG